MVDISFPAKLPGGLRHTAFSICLRILLNIKYFDAHRPIKHAELGADGRKCRDWHAYLGAFIGSTLATMPFLGVCTWDAAYAESGVALNWASQVVEAIWIFKGTWDPWAREGRLEICRSFNIPTRRLMFKCLTRPHFSMNTRSGLCGIPSQRSSSDSVGCGAEYPEDEEESCWVCYTLNGLIDENLRCSCALSCVWVGWLGNIVGVLAL